MLDVLITSKTRIKILLKFFLNYSQEDYLRNMESEFGESSNAIRQELNKLEAAGLLSSFSKGNRKYFKSNQYHPLFKDINSILLKFTGIDQIIKTVLQRLGEVDNVYITGDLCEGKDSNIVDLVIIGSVNRDYLSQLVSKAEKHISKKIKYLVYDKSELVSNPNLIKKSDLLIYSN